jgi:uncharacterized SAM-binding protein YcdF (DUF218 family)
MSISATIKTLVTSIVATLILYLAYQFVDLRLQNSVTNVGHTDCIVVLGAAVWPGAQPSPVLRDRLVRATELYHEGVADKIICSGGVGKYPPAEAEVEKQVLMKAGVAEKDIIMEATSSSTSEQAERIKEICDREGFRSIALVTSFFHEKRAIQLFRSAGFKSIEDARCTHERFEDLDFWVAREAMALAIMSWWQWAAIGLSIGALALGYRSVRQRERENQRGRIQSIG